MALIDMMVEKVIKTPLESRDKPDVLRELVQILKDADEIDDFELAVAWDDGSNEPSQLRDVTYHESRGTYLVRERDLGQPPHSVVEFATVEEAVEAANEGVAGYIRRREARDDG